MAALGPSRNNVIMALVVILLPGAVRVVRSQVLSIKELDYTLAARAIGAGSGRIMLRHILPNIAATYIVLATINVGYAIVVEGPISGGRASHTDDSEIARRTAASSGNRYQELSGLAAANGY